NGACTFWGESGTIFSPGLMVLKSIVVETFLGDMSRTTFGDPRRRTCTEFVVSPVISMRGGMLRYSRATSMLSSDDASVATIIQSIVASTSEISFRCQL